MIRIAVLLFAMVATASANVAKRRQSGEPAGEPVGITDVAIVREELVIDMRPVIVKYEPVKVMATYHLDNRGAEKQLDLLFATGSQTRRFVVTFDGKPVASVLDPEAVMPESWRPPETTPLFDGGTLRYWLPREKALPTRFKLVIPPGRHDLVISYEAEAVINTDGDPTVYQQFGYVLSPARSWAGFGGLDLTVYVPSGWDAAITPALEREGDTLRGTFTTVPADAVAITVQAPVVLYFVLLYASRALFALVAIGGLVVLVRRTRASEKRRLDAGKFPNTYAAFARGILWGAAFFGAGMFTIVVPAVAVGGQGDNHGYGQAFAAVGVVLGAIVASVTGWIVSYGVGRRVHLPPTDA